MVATWKAIFSNPESALVAQVCYERDWIPHVLNSCPAPVDSPNNVVLLTGRETSQHRLLSEEEPEDHKASKEKDDHQEHSRKRIRWFLGGRLRPGGGRCSRCPSRQLPLA